MKKTKIIATVGPSCESTDKIIELISNGVDVFRINMSHEDDPAKFRALVKKIRSISIELKKHVAVMQDLSGPKIRVSKLINELGIKIEKKHTYSIGFGDFDIPMNMNPKFNSSSTGGIIKVDDGSISFTVLDIKDDCLMVEAVNDGTIKPGKGINFPGVKLDLPAITQKDEIDVKLGLSENVDWIAMSFVRSAEDYNLVKGIMEQVGKYIPVIAKIEKPEAMKNLDSIIDAFDGILTARGDLGVEMHINELPVLQKQIVNLCLFKRKPVIIATQMLETMIHNPAPTRAEVNDIANAIYDRADAVMLSGETAVGHNPLEAVKMMESICNTVEKDFDSINFNLITKNRKFNSKDDVESICNAAMMMADNLEIENIVVMTESGTTARTMAQYRPHSHIIALCPYPKVCRQLSLIWGITSIKVDQYNSGDEILYHSARIVREEGILKKGESFILTAGLPVGIPGTTNLLKLHSA